MGKASLSSVRFSTVILAAGKGTRMCSDLPKVLHPLAGMPLIGHVLRAVLPLDPSRVVVVVAPGMASVEAVCRKFFDGCRFAVQHAQKGTGDAVRAALSELPQEGKILVLYGDTPLMRTETLAAFLAQAASVDVAVLGMRLAQPEGYGRLIVSPDGQLEAIVESKDATPEQQSVTLCNSGIMCITASLLPQLLAQLSTRNAAQEYYLTDIVAHARAAGHACIAVEVEDAEELSGINTRAQLAAAEQMLQQRLRQAVMAQGATLVAPETVFLAADTRMGRDVLIHPFVVFGPGVALADGVEIRSYSHLEGALVEQGAVVGPFARLRPGTVLEPQSHVGNFVELKASRLGRGAKANHLSYIGDAVVGSSANIGAGTITCNYDGVRKYQTQIGEGAFIGSNTALVAPVVIGAGAMVAAGSVITEDVAPDALALGRATQVVKPARASKIKQRKHDAS